MIHDVRFTYIHSSTKEMQPLRTCISFGEECISMFTVCLRHKKLVCWEQTLQQVNAWQTT